MSNYCPAMKLNVTYMDCLECEEKECKAGKKETIVLKPGDAFLIEPEDVDWRRESNELCYLGMVGDKRLLYEIPYNRKCTFLLVDSDFLKGKQIGHIWHIPWWKKLRKRYIEREIE